jgi:hypothetical protein
MLRMHGLQRSDRGKLVKGWTAARLAMALLAAGLLCVISAPVASAAPGAKVCHKGGWETLYRSDGTTFTSDKECSAFATHGGAALGLTTVAASDFWVFEVSGFGLEPLSSITAFSGGTSITYPFDAVNRQGIVLPGIHSIGPMCGIGATGFATGTTAAGTAMATPVVNSPCG